MQALDIGTFRVMNAARPFIAKGLTLSMPVEDWQLCWHTEF